MSETEDDRPKPVPAPTEEGANPDVHLDDGSTTPPHGDDKPPSPSSGV